MSDSGSSELLSGQSGDEEENEIFKDEENRQIVFVRQPSTRRSKRQSQVPIRLNNYSTGEEYPSTEETDEEMRMACQWSENFSRSLNILRTVFNAMTSVPSNTVSPRDAGNVSGLGGGGPNGDGHDGEYGKKRGRSTVSDIPAANSRPVITANINRRNKRVRSIDEPVNGFLGTSSRSDLNEPEKKRRSVGLREDGRAEAMIMRGLEKIWQDIGSLRSEMRDGFLVLNRRINALSKRTEQERSSMFPRKPDCLPLKRPEDLVAFETTDIANFNQVVNFLGALSSGSLAEKANVILKEAIADDLAPGLTMQGGKPNTSKVEGTRFSDALYASMCKGIPSTDRPSRRSYLEAVTTALKAAKQRYRRLQVLNVTA